jgi:hypothetical protein
MHRMHNMYLKSLQDKKLCEKYIQELFECYANNFSIEKEKIIIEKMNLYCYNHTYNSFSNKEICDSVNSCGVTLK